MAHLVKSVAPVTDIWGMAATVRVSVRRRLGIPTWWWIGIPLVAIIYATLAWWLPALSQALATDDSPAAGLTRRMLESMSVAAAPYAVIFGLAGWAVFVARAASDARRLDRQTGIDSIRQLPWREFELLLAEAFRRQAYRVTDTGPGADGGVDLILDGKNGRVLVQAKQWRTKSVGVPKVRELLGLRTAHRASGAILVTSGRATDQARRFARANGIQLIEGPQLEGMIRDAQWQASSANPDPQQADIAEVECPSCGSPMVRRTARRGARTGQDFWGCSTYPRCRGTRDIA